MSIAQPFSVSAIPPSAHLCAILDRAADGELITNLLEMDPHNQLLWAELFPETHYAELSSTGPLLLWFPCDGEIRDYVLALIEQAHAGCLALLPQRHLFGSASEHCRHLLTATDDRQQERLCRFFEPRWLEPLLTSLNDDERQQFFGPFSALIWWNELGWRVSQRQLPWSGLVPARGWLLLDQKRHQQLREARLKVIAERLASDYQPQLRHQGAPFVVQQLKQAERHGYSGISQWEGWLRLGLRHGPEFASEPRFSTILNNPDLAPGERLKAMEQL